MDQTNNDAKEQNVKKITLEEYDVKERKGVRTSDHVDWFNAIVASCLAITGIFLGIIICCLIILSQK